MDQQSGNSEDSDYHGIIDNGRTMGWKFQQEIDVNKSIVVYLKIARGINRKRLEQATKTEIRVQESRQNSKAIIKGNNKSDIVNARKRLDGFRGSPRRQLFTHFLSIPFTTNEIKANFIKFRDEILSDNGIEGIDAELFQTPERMHLTLTMLVLLDEQSEKDAREYLERCKEEIIDEILKDKPLTVELVGAATFDDEDPSKVSVLFGKIQSQELQEIANNFAYNFANNGLVQLVYPEVTLHVTLMNVSFLKKRKENEGEVGKAKAPAPRYQRRTFNASKIIEKYKNFNFGSLTINEIQISKLGKSENPSGFYDSLSVLKF